MTKEKYVTKYYLTKDDITLLSDGRLWTYVDRTYDYLLKKYTKDDAKFVFDGLGIILLSCEVTIIRNKNKRDIELKIYKSKKLYKDKDYVEVVKNFTPYISSKDYRKDSVVAILKDGTEVELVRGEPITVDKPLSTSVISEAVTDEYYSNWFD